MKFALAFYGTHGDVDPGVAVGRELMRRGHEVRVAVPPDLVGFAEAVGLPTVAYGLDVQAQLDGHRNFWSSLFRNFWRIQELRRLWQEGWAPVTQCWAHMNTTLLELADGADVLFTTVYTASAVVSGAVFAGFLSWLLARGLAATGALESFAIGRERRARV